MSAKQKNKKESQNGVYHSTETIPKLYKKLNKCSTKDLEKLLEKDRKEEESNANPLLTCFHARTNRALAETKINKAIKTNQGQKCEGMYLIRTNAASSGDFVVSFNVGSGDCAHFVICQRKQGWYSFNKGKVLQGLDNLVAHFTTTADGLPTKLTTPCPGGNLLPALSVHRGYTNILHAAVIDGKHDAVAKIVECKACPDIDSKSCEGSTSLHIASGHGLAKVAEVLLAKGAVVNCLDAKGFTPLHIASLRGHADVVALLLKAGANPQCRHSDTGKVPLHEAARLNHIECVKVFMSYNVPVFPRQYATLDTPTILALNNDHHECERLLDNYRPPPAQTTMADWFHDTIDRKGATALLDQYENADGHFLVRKNSKDPSKSVLTYSYDHTVTNLVIQNMMHTAFWIDDGPLLSSLAHVIEHYCIFDDGLEGVLTHAIRPNGSLKEMMISHPTKPVAKPNSPMPTLPPRMHPPTGGEPTALDPASLFLEYEIGQGEYGSVMKGVWTAPDGSKLSVAVKTLHAQYLELGKENLIREAKVMVRFRHPCIVKLIGVCESTSLMLVQELVELGALLDYLLDYPEKIGVRKDMYRWAAQIACGMMYLEEEGIVHRDLATRNILLASPTQAKVADFGLSRGVGSSDYYKASKGGRWPVKWYAPESINYGTFSSASDVWSYGVTLWEMFSYGEQPYGDMTGAQVIQLIERNGRLHKPDKCPDDAYSIMQDCWKYKPAERPTFKKLFDDFQKTHNYVSFTPEGKPPSV